MQTKLEELTSDGDTNTELLDLIQGVKDSAMWGSTLSQKGDEKNVSFVVGGSLFSSQTQHHPHHHHRQSKLIFTKGAAHLRDRTGRPLSVPLNYGSLYCPFTRQFFSLNSPHWRHLSAAGFGLDPTMKAGRCVSLLRPRMLYAIACKLQGRRPVSTNQQRLGSVPAEPSHEIGRAANTFYRDAHWGKLLSSTLGAALESCPVHTYSAFQSSVVQPIKEETHPSGYRKLLLHLKDDDGKGDHPSLLARQCHQRSDAFQPAHGRLQLHRREEEETEVEVEAPAWCSEWALDIDQSDYGWMRGLADCPVVPMLGLPPYTRAAAIHVSSAVEEARAAMDAAGSMVLNHIRATACSTSTPCRVYVCPIERPVDYSSVLDIQAYRVDTPHAPPAAGSASRRSQTVPVLALGLDSDVAGGGGSEPGEHSTQAKSILVVQNAQYFSKRAMSRMLDQWTRNGAANRLVAKRAGCRGDASWKLLLGVEPFASPVRMRYSHPFGNVQVIFLFNDFTEADAAEAEGQHPATQALSVTGSLFHLQEPLSSALVRLAPHYRHSMDLAHRALLVRDVCDAALSQLPEPFMLQQTHSKRAPSGRYMFEETLQPLHCGLGAELFYNACEMLLLADTVDMTMRCLRQFPFLSTIECHHRLVDSYRLRGFTGGKATHGISDATEENKMSPVLPVPMPSRADVLRAEEAWREKNIRTVRAHHCARQRPHRCRRETSHQRPAVLEEQYAAFMEPPVLLGHWTDTLLFCAPLFADVIPLKMHVIAMLRSRATCIPTDVDVYHVDYILFTPRRRCRLFGIRALCQAGATAGDCALLNAALHDCLRDCAVQARFFPLWTYDTQTQRELAADTLRASADGFRFSSLLEGQTPSPPHMVERRLFSISAAQQPRLHLTVGSHVVLQRALTNSSGHSLLPGQLCIVKSFKAVADLTSPPGHGSAAIELYAAQQHRGTVSLPVVSPIHQPSSDVDQGEYVVTPSTFLVGGYASLHYYALPALHLPLHHLIPATPTAAKHDPFQFYYPSPHVLHPYHAHDHSIAALCFTPTHHASVLRYAVERGSALSFMEDMALLSGAEGDASASSRSGERQWVTQAAADVDGAGADAPAPQVQAQTLAPAPKPSLCSRALTEFSLYIQQPETGGGA